MKNLKFLLLLFSFITINVTVKAQTEYRGADFRYWNQLSVGKGDGTPTNSAAWLEIGKYGTSKGVIIPRGNVFSIANAEGNFAYDINTKSLYYNDGAFWIQLFNSNLAAGYDSAFVRAQFSSSTGILKLFRKNQEEFNLNIAQNLSLVGSTLSISGANFVTLNTNNVTEGANLYFTPTRARSVFTMNNGITYDNTTGFVKLGGTLNQNTGIDLSTFNFSLNNGVNNIFRANNNGDITFGGYGLRNDAGFNNKVLFLDINGVLKYGITDYLTAEIDPVFTASPASAITPTNITNWNTAYNDKINSAAFTGTTTKTLTLTQQDGGTITASFNDDNSPVTASKGLTKVVNDIQLGGSFTSAIAINSNNLSQFSLDVNDGTTLGTGVANQFNILPSGFTVAAYDFPNNNVAAFTMTNSASGIIARNGDGFSIETPKGPISGPNTGTSILQLGKYSGTQSLLQHQNGGKTLSLIMNDTSLVLISDSADIGAGTNKLTSVQLSHNYVAISATGNRPPSGQQYRKVYINADPWQADPLSNPQQYWMFQDTIPVQIASSYNRRIGSLTEPDTASRVLKVWGRTVGKPAIEFDEYITKAQLDASGSGTVLSVGLTSTDLNVGGTSPITTSGTFTLTLPNINSNVGTFNNLTVNAKGQVTAASNVSYELVANKVTSLSSPNNTTYPTTLAVSNAISAIPNYWAVSGTDDITNTNVGFVNIGGGSFSSAYKFTVNGSSAFTGSLDLHSPTSHYGFSNFDIGYATLGYQSGTARPIYISATTDGGNQLVLHTDDNVGIGTTSPATKLEVNGITTTTAIYSPNLSDLVLWSQNGNHMNFAVGNSSTKMSLDDNGRLGIGTIPNSLRASLLEVEGNAWATDAWILGTGTTPLAEFGLSGGAFVRTMTTTNLDFIINAATLVARANGTNANFEISNQIKIAGGNPGIGKVLTDSDGNGLAEWTTIGGGSGTVTSVGVSSTDLSVSGSPITTSGSITLNVNNDAITYAKLQNVTASRLLGRYTGSNGDAQEITIGSGLSLNSGTGELTATGGSGTVTSVGLTSSDITVGGTSPITSSGTFTLTLPNIVSANTFNNITFNAKGQVTGGSNVSYLTSESDPVFGASSAAGITGTDITNWNAAYNDKINSAAFTGTSTKTLTLTQQDGGTVTANFTDQGITSESDPVANAKTVTLTNGTGISISGSAQTITSNPAFTITNTAPDQTVVLNSGTGISVSGTYPNFTITNTDPAGGGGSITLVDYITDVTSSSLYNYSVSNTRLTNDGDKLKVTYGGVFNSTQAGNVNLVVGGTTLALAGITTGDWYVEALIIRVSNTVVRVVAHSSGPSGIITQMAEVTGLNLTSTGLSVNLTSDHGSATTAQMGTIIFFPYAPAP